MVKGFRYKLYSTVSDSDQLKKEEKVIFIVIVIGEKHNNQIVHMSEETNVCSISSEHKGIWNSLGLK